MCICIVNIQSRCFKSCQSLQNKYPLNEIIPLRSSFSSVMKSFIYPYCNCICMEMSPRCLSYSCGCYPCTIILLITKIRIKHNPSLTLFLFSIFQYLCLQVYRGVKASHSENENNASTGCQGQPVHW